MQLHIPGTGVFVLASLQRADLIFTFWVLECRSGWKGQDMSSLHRCFTRRKWIYSLGNLIYLNLQICFLGGVLSFAGLSSRGLGRSLFFLELIFVYPFGVSLLLLGLSWSYGSEELTLLHEQWEIWQLASNVKVFIMSLSLTAVSLSSWIDLGSLSLINFKMLIIIHKDWPIEYQLSVTAQCVTVLC